MQGETRRGPDLPQDTITPDQSTALTPSRNLRRGPTTSLKKLPNAPPSPFVRPDEAASHNEQRQSQTFVLEVDGTRLLGENPDWRFLLTNCTPRILRYVQLDKIRSEIGAYELFFKELPVMQPGEKIVLSHEVLPRREIDKDSDHKPTLWDFALDHAGERGHTYIWYDLAVQYRDDDDTLRDGGLLGVCFDLKDKKLKTEGAEYFRKNNYKAMFEKSGAA